MLSKSQIRFITSLQQKKFRKAHGVFVVEGAKSVQEFIQSDYEVTQVFFTLDTLAKMGKIPQTIKFNEVTVDELKKISSLKTPQGVLALVKVPEDYDFVKEDFMSKFTLVLDDVQDPGNMGTIIRTADWFGFQHLICSVGSVDVFNPKTIQATMGSLSRVKIHYMDLQKLFSTIDIPVFGALLDGKPIYSCDFGSEGFIVLGNEGKGISDEVIGYIDHPVTIPRVGQTESLNVAISAALFCAEIVRPK